MITIVFESHATTLDNEQKIASGHIDVALSPKGEQQARELGERRRGEHFDAIFCSDMQRSYNTARLAFGADAPIMHDWRLRECNYGELEHQPSSRIEAERPQRLATPFPGGESYEQCAARMRSFLADMLTFYEGTNILIIGHRATQYGLQRWASGEPLAEIVSAPWAWQPGWQYELRQLKD